MYASIFNTESFVAATLFIERLLQNEDHVFNIIDQCQNDPTLSLDLQLILEAAATEKQLEDKLGYKDNNVLRLHTIVITAIAAAIQHGILNTIRDSKKLPVVPDYIPSHFAGQGIVQYFENDYQCGGCLWWEPGHTTPNCEIKKEADRVWENEAKKYREYRPWGYDTKTGEQRWKAIYKWAGVQDIPNKEWDTPKKEPEVIDLTSPSPPPSLLPTPPPSLWTPPSSPPYRPWSPSQLTPLLNLTDLVSDFDSVASSNSSISNLGNVGDIEV
ncbi:hypothetical protein K443DRAFT_14593 [Laccaria amethystina LaAM-08-1]|uniref:Uncharacterized protein n=1 Tax=Laccaria amethystina LaAM-08-1 TaxID=1095629 RepID=A0A0C9X3U5_9AGAR|nr:hypothetical protein K443DRAFT_14593 [Laccaria amethystina LaAM-08-1]